MSFAGDENEGKPASGAKAQNSHSNRLPAKINSKEENENNHLHFEVQNQHMKLISGAALKAKKTRQDSLHHDREDPYTAELIESIKVHKATSGRKKAAKSPRQNRRDEEKVNAVKEVEMVTL